jgi:hypothetical protein
MASRRTREYEGYGSRFGVRRDAETFTRARSYKYDILWKMFGATRRGRARLKRISAIPQSADGRTARFACARSGWTPDARSRFAGVVPPGRNVLGVGFGMKQTEGRWLDVKECVRVYVRRKRPMKDLPNAERVPKTINGLPTDVEAVGTPRAFAPQCGDSVGLAAGKTGTIGCIVRTRGHDDGARYILSNNHVLADVNVGRPGDPVLQPGPYDQGREPEIADLHQFVRLNTTTADGAWWNAKNWMDAATARLDDPSSVSRRIREIGNIVLPSVPAATGVRVAKYGRTTQYREGVIRDIAADKWIQYGDHWAWFDDQLQISSEGAPFAAEGDSGALVVDAGTRRPIGLLFGGDGVFTFATPIQWVLDKFLVDIVTA